jgi:hypothetical protein
MPTYRKLHGFNVRRTSRGWTVVELDIHALPERDPCTQAGAAWGEAERRAVGEVAFRREHMRDWTAAPGEPYYPEFVSNPKRYIRRADALLDRPVYRGWDFGFRRPACVWFQVSSTNRTWVLRELRPENIDTYSFRDLVLYLSGQRQLEDILHRTRAVEWINRIRDNPRLPPPPWFPMGTNYLDYGGPEAHQRRAAVEGESSERTDADVLLAGGVSLQVFNTPVRARSNIVRRLLQIRADGWPGLLFDPACPELVLGFGGGIKFKKPTPENPIPDEPHKDERFSHLHEALGYGIVNCVPLADDYPQEQVAHRWEGRERVPFYPSSGFEVSEVEASRW